MSDAEHYALKVELGRAKQEKTQTEAKIAALQAFVAELDAKIANFEAQLDAPGG